MNDSAASNVLCGMQHPFLNQVVLDCVMRVLEDGRDQGGYDGDIERFLEAVHWSIMNWGKWMDLLEVSLTSN